MRFTIYMLRTVSVFSLFYAILIVNISGIRTSFLSFWFALAVISLGVSFLLSYLFHSSSHGQHIVARVLLGLIWFAITIFCIVESKIIIESMKPPATNAEYVIVLGAQVRGSNPSKTLYMRIKTAAQYLIENPTSKVICSGGQGNGEDITEAFAIQQGLLAQGIQQNRIIIEDESTNTVENLIYSKEKIANLDANVVIITSDFHVYRAKKIAEHLGYTNITMCSANEFLVTTVSYYVREFFALTKDYLVGNLR